MPLLVYLLLFLIGAFIATSFYMRSLTIGQRSAYHATGKHRLLWKFDQDAADYTWNLQELNIAPGYPEMWVDKTACRTKYEAKRIRDMYRCELYLHDHAADLFIKLDNRTLDMPDGTYEGIVYIEDVRYNLVKARNRPLVVRA